MFEGLARVPWETGRFEDARKSAARAREFAKSPAQLDYITRFLRAIGYKLTRVSIARRRDAAVGLHGRTGEIRNTGEVTHEFTCGPQQREPVKIEFTPEASGPAIGAVVSIEFRKP
jgi:hypothetical protein